VQDWRYSVAAVFVTSLIMSGASLLVSARYADQAARKSCASIVVIDNYFRKAPPSQGDDPRAKAAREWAAANHKQRRELHCDKRG
jgi:hypothetical protein